MATIKLGSTKSASRAINYAEKRAVEKSGHNCDIDYAKSNFKELRMLYGKDDGIQAHTIIQSFQPGEVTAEQANEIGLELAKSVAKDYQVAIYTHADKEHIHNHIVINSVNIENGSKYQAHGKEAIERVREASDRLCKERDLSIVKEKSAEMRYTQAEKALIDNDKFSWKDDIRDKVDIEKQHAKSYEEFKQNLTEKHGIEVLERGKNITFKHPDNDRKVRGSRLGNSYEKETLKNEFEKRKRG
ncbi:relaxase/mobilization nuclease domain-containing protein, partial [Priestia endophytica]|uniref:relaxase/mobilization nuclease domain-containing protein n=1 Tax=Priestia endophytica TaxID=135735 RepID=UPI00227ECEB7